MKRLCLIAGLSLAACSQQTAEPPADPAAELAQARAHIEADVRFLSDDLLRGRDTGTPGYDIAASYVAAEFRKIGLEPLGENGTYLAPVPLVETRSTLTGGGTMAVTANGETTAFTPNEDFIAYGRGQGELSGVELVFAGWGFASDSHGRNDYEGLDVEGKAVVVISGAPDGLNSEERAHFSRSQADAAGARGAVAFIQILPPAFEENVRPFGAYAANRDRQTRITFLDEDGEVYSSNPTIGVSLRMGQVGAERLFALAGRDWSEVAADAQDDGVVEGFDMGIRASFAWRDEARPIESANVAGLIPGSDPTLAGEIIAVSAHLDHIGTIEDIREDADTIFNGAMDNGSGVAGILEIARRFAEDPPRRSVMFVALTAEEKGLVGSQAMLENPPFDADRLVGAFNFDMPILHPDFTHIVVFGLERTTMEPLIRAAVETAGYAITPDPNPEQLFFVRSDQYSFIRKGVPSAYIDQAIQLDMQDATQAFLDQIYHEVTDEADEVLFTELAEFALINEAAIRAVADADERPYWRHGDFFGTVFNGPMEPSAAD